MNTSNTSTLLNLFLARLPGTLAFAFDSQTPIAVDHPLGGEIDAALASQTASLPYVRNQDILWVTVAPNAKELRHAIEDLRCWLLPSYGWEAVPAVVSNTRGAGPIGALLLQQSPQGYFRWVSRRADLDTVIERLATMRAVISRTPARETQLRPTLESLRRQFALGLATGDHDLALKAVDEVDQHQLDSAPNTLSMRIRLAAAFGDDQAIVTHPLLDDLLSMRVPRRVVESVLRAHYALVVAGPEAAGDLDSALVAYGAVADRLVGLAGTPLPGADSVIVAMAAYDAAYNDDAVQLRLLATQFPDNLVAAELANRFAEPEALQSASNLAALSSQEVSRTAYVEAAVDETAPQVVEPQDPISTPAELPVPESWAEVPMLLASGARQPLQTFLERVALDPDRFDPGRSDFVFEIFTDTNVMADPARAADADQLLTAVIDGYISEDRFPRRERLPLYAAVLDIWSSNRAQSTDPIDGHLLLTLADALLRLDGKLETAIATAIMRWWETRPVRSRLAWLGEALELLTNQSSSQDPLVLWYEGASLIRLDQQALSVADRHLWHRLGRRLGLDEAATDAAIGALPAPDAFNDPLFASGFKKVAIVSLHERAAREAATQIEARTHANVIVVTDHAAGEGTTAAATADVILFVWGATKHAVYRAFDKVRDRLEYVQGTGSSSIVRALERRAQQRI